MKENQRLLYKEAEQQKIKVKIDLLKDKYEQFEKGEIKSDDFKDFIVSDLGVQPSEKLEKILKAPQPDGKNFTNFVMNLELLNKKDGYKVKPKSNPHFTNKYARFKKVLPAAETKESESDPNYSLKKYSKQLLNKAINPDEYRDILRTHGINPNVESINKMIRKHESGENVKFNELLFTVIKNRDTKFDPTKVDFEVKKCKYYTESKPAEDDMLMTGANMNSKSQGGQLVHCTKKKKVSCNYNSYVSNKETFDWEAGTLAKIKNGELSPPVMNKENIKHKTVFLSQVFDDTPLFESPKKERTSTAFFKGSGDFFTWKGNSVNFSADVSSKSTVKRRNPNETSRQEVLERKPVKVNKMLLSSEENVLNRRKV